MVGHDDRRVGERVGNFQIRRPLGRGGAATVYEAESEEGVVALKIMHAHDPSGVGKRRFVREAALVSKLKHPHVIEIFSYGHTADSVPYIVFELLRGNSLKTTLRRLGSYPPIIAATITIQVLQAMVAAHAMGIIHRDIKPANIFICNGQPTTLTKVLDFGLAKALEGEGAEVASITDTGYRLGTPRYMSPEMARGKTVGGAGDIYAVGLVLAEMISGKPVVKGTSQIDVLMAHASGSELEFDELVVQSPFAQTIRRATKKELSERFATADAMLSELETVLSLHVRAAAIAHQIGDVAPDQAATVLYETTSRADPLDNTDELAPTTEPVGTGKARQPAKTVAFPDGFNHAIADFTEAVRGGASQHPPAFEQPASDGQLHGRAVGDAATMTPGPAAPTAAPMIAASMTTAAHGNSEQPVDPAPAQPIEKPTVGLPRPVLTFVIVAFVLIGIAAAAWVTLG